MMKHLLRKVFRCLFFFAGLLLMLSVKAQDPDKPVSLNLKNVRLSDALNEVRKQTDANFIYSVDDLSRYLHITINVNKKQLPEVLNLLLKGTDMQYSIENNTVIIKRKPADRVTSSKVTDSLIKISGVVASAKGAPLTGVSVADLSTARSTITDVNGKYYIIAPRKTVLRFTYVGMKPQQVVIKADEDADLFTQNLQMEVAPAEMSQVVFTGYQSIRKQRWLARPIPLSAKICCLMAPIV